MASKIEDPGEDGKKVTVLFNLKDWGRIEKEMVRLLEVNGYKPTVSDILRKLVDEGLPQ